MRGLQICEVKLVWRTFLKMIFECLQTLPLKAVKGNFQIVLTHNFSFLGASTTAPLRSISVIMVHITPLIVRCICTLKNLKGKIGAVGLLMQVNK